MEVRSEVEYKKESPGDSVWWVHRSGVVGTMAFTFDKRRIYNLFRDYPDKLSVEEWMAFNRENPYWEHFFRGRNEKYKEEHRSEILRFIKNDS